MINRIRHTIIKYRMLRGGETVVAAVSGGMDSVALLHALNLLREEFRLTLVVAHLNHNLRGEESERDMRFVMEKAEALGLAFEGKTLLPGELEGFKGRSLQELARERRYAFLEEAARRHGADRIALGHTMDDQAETVLMRLLKGASLQGLGGIPPVRGMIIRPLIETTREEIERFVAASSIGYVVDSSNLKDKYLRNDIRHHLIPFIKERYNPNIIEALSRTASILRDDEDILERETEKAFSSAFIEKTAGGITLDIEKLRGVAHGLAARAVLKGLRSLETSEAYSCHLEAVVSLMESDRPNAFLSLPGGVRAVREYGKLSLTRQRPSVLKPFEADIIVPGETSIEGTGFVFRTTVFEPPPGERQAGKGAAWFDLDAIERCGGLKARRFTPGDRIAPLGMKGHKKLKEIFIDAKVPRLRRLETPVFVAGPEVVWVYGLRQSEIFRVGKETRRAVLVERVEGPF